jgi:hypothetical protein
MKRSVVFVTVLASAFLIAPAWSASFAVLNGDFETGDFSDWSVFTTPLGTNVAGFPTVVPFDTNGDSTATNSAAFRVGTTDGSLGGGGIYQSVTVDVAGDYTLSASIASDLPIDSDNSDGGRFDLMMDGNVVDSFNFGFIAGYSTERDVLSALLPLTIGSHEIRILIQRSHTVSSTVPFQYIDGVSLLGSEVEPGGEVPEPSSAALVLVGCAALILSKRVRRKCC